jgi:hypothetical protein
MIKKVKESTTAGAVATVAMPLGGVQSRTGVYPAKKTTKKRYSNSIIKEQLNLSHIEEQFGVIVPYGGAYTKNQRLFKHLIESYGKNSNKAITVFEYIMEKKLGIGENINADDADLNHIFDTFSKFCKTIPTVGEKYIVHELEAFPFAKHKKIFLTGSNNFMKVADIDGEFIYFSDGNVRPKSRITHVGRWSQISLFTNLEDAQKCEFWMKHLAGKYDNWDFEVDIDQGNITENSTEIVNTNIMGNKMDHEISMATSELESIIADARKLLVLVNQYSEMQGLEAWQQSKITKAADYIASVLRALGSEQGALLESVIDQEIVNENLRKWFKEKWVRFNPQGKIMGPCARGSDKEGKPKCLPQKKAQALGKKARASAASRKRREDPNPERSGKALNVNTKKKSVDEAASAAQQAAIAISMKKAGKKPKKSVHEDRCDDSLSFNGDAEPQLIGLSFQDIDRLCESCGKNFIKFTRNIGKNLELPLWTDTVELYGYYVRKLDEHKSGKIINEGAMSDIEGNNQQ